MIKTEQAYIPTSVLIARAITGHSLTINYSNTDPRALHTFPLPSNYNPPNLCVHSPCQENCFSEMRFCSLLFRYRARPTLINAITKGQSQNPEEMRLYCLLKLFLPRLLLITRTAHKALHLQSPQLTCL